MEWKKKLRVNNKEYYEGLNQGAPLAFITMLVWLVTYLFLPNAPILLCLPLALIEWLLIAFIAYNRLKTRSQKLGFLAGYNIVLLIAFLIVFILTFFGVR